MSRHANKKQRHEQKRREKRSLLRRADQGSPYKKIGLAGSTAACYINDDWREDGLASIQILLRVPGGGHALACFLVDRWCIGLKDAFGCLTMTAEEFRLHLERSASQGVHHVPVDMATVRRLVAGAIRWSRDHNFRLPPRYERWVSMIGGVGDWSAADVSDFGVDGQLHYVGAMEDLEHRLIGTTLEEFVAREDVEILAGSGPSLIDDEEDDIVEEGARLVQEELLKAVRRWCFAQGQAPHPRLDEAVEMLLTSILQTPASGEEPSPEEIAQSEANQERMLALEGAASAAELRIALEQVAGFMKGFKTPAEMIDALGIPPVPEDE